MHQFDPVTDSVVVRIGNIFFVFTVVSIFGVLVVLTDVPNICDGNSQEKYINEATSRARIATRYGATLDESTVWS